MRLVIDIGNSQIHYGIIDKAKGLVHESRCDTRNIAEFAVGLVNLSYDIDSIAVSSVVPSMDETIELISKKIFNIKPFFLSIESCRDISFDRYTRPKEIGADILASLVYAYKYHRNSNLIIVDLGTANTIVAINKDSQFLGGIIMPGVNAQYKALIASAEKLENANISKLDYFIGDTTEKAINSGIVNGIAGSLKFIVSNTAKENFGDDKFTVIGTGGTVELFTEFRVFDKVVQDLLLLGLYDAYDSAKL